MCEEEGGPRPVVFGLVNGLLIRKERFDIEMYPELMDFARELIRLLELVYEHGIRKGMEHRGDDDTDDAPEVFAVWFAQ